MNSNSMNLISAGSQLANIAYNLAQRAGQPLSQHDALLLDAARKNWDEARRTPAAPKDVATHNPHPGARRDPRDVASGPHAQLCGQPGAALRAAQQAPADAGQAQALTDAQLLPNWAGKFTSYQHWVNKAQSWLKSPDHRRAMCVDVLGRRCAMGADFMRARDEGAFPVRFFWDCVPQPAQCAAPDESDTKRLDYLETMVVNVRTNLRYGSRDLFWASPSDDDGDAGPSDIRSQIDAALAAQQKNGGN